MNKTEFCNRFQIHSSRQDTTVLMICVVTADLRTTRSGKEICGHRKKLRFIGIFVITDYFSFL